jgi:hypothetical protein
MSFDENCVKTLEAISGLRSYLRATLALSRRRARARIPKARTPRVAGYRDFATMTDITPAAALVIAAEFERNKILTGNPPVVVNVANWDPKVLLTLSEIGFLEIVGFPRGQSHIEGEGPIKVLRMRSGRTADVSEVARLVADLKGLYPGPDDQSIEGGMMHLYGAMIEAVGNVCGHAYPGKLSSSTVDRWWMTGAVDTVNRRTTAVIFDQGVSIPGSLPNWTRYAGVIRRLLAAFKFVPNLSDHRYDGAAISVAVEESVSSTGEAHRGHGLAQMKTFVDLCRDGYLRIMSRKGEVIFRPGGNPIITTHSASIGGTLIEWNVSL